MCARALNDDRKIFGVHFSFFSPLLHGMKNVHLLLGYYQVTYAIGGLSVDTKAKPAVFAAKPKPAEGAFTCLSTTRLISL